MNFHTTYAVGNDLFAQFDLIFGWCVWSYGNIPEPISGLSDEHAAALQKLFVGPLYPDELKQAIANRRNILAGDASVLARLANKNRHEDKLPKTPAIRTDEGRNSFENGGLIRPLVARNPDLNRGTVQKLTVTPVKMKEFPMPARHYHLVYSAVQHGDELHQLMERFGNRWNKVPPSVGPNLFYVKSRPGFKPMQMSMRLDDNGVPAEFTMYFNYTWEEFIFAWESGKSMESVSILLGDTHCMGTRIVNALKAAEVW